MAKSFQKGFTGIFPLILLAIGLFVGVYLVGTKTNLFSKASTSATTLNAMQSIGIQTPFFDLAEGQEQVAVEEGEVFPALIEVRADHYKVSEFDATINYDKEYLEVVDLQVSDRYVGHPKLDNVLNELISSDNKQDFASLNNLELKDDRVLVLIDLINLQKSPLWEEYGTEVERAGGVLKAYIPIDKLVAVGEDIDISYIYPPGKKLESTLQRLVQSSDPSGVAAEYGLVVFRDRVLVTMKLLNKDKSILWPEYGWELLPRYINEPRLARAFIPFDKLQAVSDDVDIAFTRPGSKILATNITNSTSDSNTGQINLSGSLAKEYSTYPPNPGDLLGVVYFRGKKATPFYGTNIYTNGSLNDSGIISQSQLIKIKTQPNNLPTPTTAPILELPKNTSSNPDVFIIEDDGSIETDSRFNELGVTKLFYEQHEDKYDFMAVFPLTDNAVNLGLANPFSMPVRNDVRGICAPIRNPDYDTLKSNKLKAFQMMAMTDEQYKSWLEVPLIGVSILMHEIGHTWSAHVGDHAQKPNLDDQNFRDFVLIDGVNEECFKDGPHVLYKDAGHWSLGLQMPEGSFSVVPYAVPWVDRGDGTYSYNTHVRSIKFHPFDLYYMGLMDVSEFNKEYLLIVHTKDQDFTPGIPPEGQLLRDMPINSTNFSYGWDSIIKDVTVEQIGIQDIINAAGEVRQPSAQDSQKDFKTAFVIVKKPGQEIPSYILDAINLTANNLPTVWSHATDNRSKMNQD